LRSDELMAKSPRAEQLTKLRDLIVLSHRQNVTSQRDLQFIAVRKKIFVKDDGAPWKYSRIFQYLDGLHWLGFNIAEKRSGQITLNEDGKELASVGQKNYGSDVLNADEKRIFAKRIFMNNYVQQNFIRFFSPKQRPIQAVSEFKKAALPVYVTNIYRKVTTREKRVRSKARRLCDIRTEEAEYKEIESTEFLHTIRYWLRDLEIIDDINISPRYGVKLNYMIFPIKSRITVTETLRLEKMIEEVWPQNTANMPVPVILYELCRRFSIPLEDAKQLVQRLFHESPDRYYLNRAPESLLDIKYKRSYIRTSDGFWRDELYLRHEENE
jgi:hypothetical protein